MTVNEPPIPAPDAVDDGGNEVFESSRGVRFLGSPQAKCANLPAPTPEEIESSYRNVARTPDTRIFTRRSMQARMLWLGRLPPTRPGDGPPNPASRSPTSS